METRGGKVRRKPTDTELNDEDTPHDENRSPEHEDMAEEEMGEASLANILKELKDFRRDNMKQLADIQQKLNSTNDRLEEAESRIDDVETAMQAASTILKKLVQKQEETEAKLTDQEARARRENIRIYSIPEQSEGNDIITFLEEMFRDSLDFPRDVELKIERAHRALGPRPADPAKPRSIIAKFSSFRVKEEVVRRAWRKQQVFHNNKRYYVDPPAILKKRAEYTQAKKTLKEKKIRFQTPFPAKMRVFYEDGVCLYQNAAEATADMSSRGLPVTVITPTSDPLQRELQQLSGWRSSGDRTAATRGSVLSQSSEENRQRIVQKLQGFRRLSSTDW